MLVTAYGLFWRRDEVNWFPGGGLGRKSTGQPFELLGRRGATRNTLRLIDARRMSGVYLLHNDYGAYYVGLADGKFGLGSRLKRHTVDSHRDNWSTFSWFSFDSLLKTEDHNGILKYNKRPEMRSVQPSSLIRDVEAMLMLTLGTIERGNINSMKFRKAEKWHQVHLHERSDYMKKKLNS